MKEFQDHLVARITVSFRLDGVSVGNSDWGTQDHLVARMSTSRLGASMVAL